MKRERGSSEESMCILSLPDVSPEEVVDTTSSWQFVDGSDLSNHRPGSFTRYEISEHSSHLASRVTKSIPGESDGASQCPKPSGSAPDPITYYPQDMWKINTSPPQSQESGYGPPAANGTTGYRYDYSSSDSHHSSHGGSYVRFSDHHHPSSASSGFTPINQNSSTAPFPSSSEVSRTALC